MDLYRYKAKFSSYSGDEGKFELLNTIIALLGTVLFLIVAIVSITISEFYIYPFLPIIFISLSLSYLASVYPKVIFLFFSLYLISCIIIYIFAIISSSLWLLYLLYFFLLTILSWRYAYRLCQNDI